MIEPQYQCEGVALYLGDCLEVLPILKAGSVKLVVTDPPYRLTSGGIPTSESGMVRGMFRSDKYKNDGKLFELIEFRDWLPQVKSICAPNSDLYIMSNDKNLLSLLSACKDAKLGFHNLISWDKQVRVPNRWYLKQCEFIAYLWKGKAKAINNMSSSNFISIKTLTANKRHPAEKPVALMRFLIENSSSVGDTVLDPFMGSGTTGVACIQTGRSFVGIEIDKAYFNIAKSRIENAQPRLL
jgi:site-specific DNA-methyltransferase (adenine-specific)